jgi:hypothetical protein
MLSTSSAKLTYNKHLSYMIRRKAFPTPSYLAKDEVLKVTAAHCRTTPVP